MPGMVLTPMRFKVPCRRLSSVEPVLWTAFFFLQSRASGGEKMCESRGKRESKGRVRVEGLQGTFDCMHVSYVSLDGMRNAVTHLLTVPLPPVRTVPAIFCNFSTFILQI